MLYCHVATYLYLYYTNPSLQEKKVIAATLLKGCQINPMIKTLRNETHLLAAGCRGGTICFRGLSCSSHAFNVSMCVFNIPLP